MYNSGALIIFTMSCSHHNYFQNIYHPKQTLKPLAINSRYSQPLEFLIIPNLHCFYDLPILGNSHKWIHAVFTKLFHHCQTVFSSNHAVLHSHQKCTIPISTCPQWYLFFIFCGCSNPSRYEMMYHCGTDFHVPNNYDIGHFNVLTGHFI